LRRSLLKVVRRGPKLSSKAPGSLPTWHKNTE